MINRYWKGYERIADADNKARGTIESIIYEQDSAGINPLYKLYYIIKPMIPRTLQIYLRRISANFVLRDGYESLEKVYQKILIGQMGRTQNRFPFVWFWPRRMEMASLVTHDIETLSGFRRVLRLAEIDGRHQIKSSFKFVPEGYHIDTGIIRELRDRGHEIAIHGLNHDGRLFVSRKVFKSKLSKIEDYAKLWNTEGFRSPSLLRYYPLMKDFNFNWDSSFPDWDPYGPQPGGCRTVFPYFISSRTVELPVTMMQDHTLFEILRRKNISIWRNKFKYIRSMNGLANIIIHPDYIFKADRIKYYHEYLDFINAEPRVWQACPSEVSNWWRRRDQSSIVKHADGTLSVAGTGTSDASIATASLDDGKLIYSL